MLRFSVLASSSKGNATVIHGGNTALLVDVGISATRIRQGLAECELSPAQLDGLFITHEHRDHINGLEVLCRKDPISVYCSRYLFGDLRSLAPRSTFIGMEPGAPVQVGDFVVTAFPASHDAIDPLGFVFEYNGTRMGYVTDTGRVMREMKDLLQGVDALYLESNHDPDMLRNSGRPHHLIDRIGGTWGHLSNQQAGDLVRELAHSGLQHIVMGHLSEDCNTPKIAIANMRRTLDELGLATQLHCAPATYRLPWITVGEA